jgi:hypothetical protein
MKNPIAKRLLAVCLMLAAGAGASAQDGPPLPSPLMLAAIPDLTAAQQLELRKIFVQRRDAEEALLTKQQADFAALRAKNRSEHERIDDNTDAALRKLLGDDGYRKFAQWQLANRPDGPRGRGGPGVGPGGPGGGGPRPPHGAGPAGPGPQAELNPGPPAPLAAPPVKTGQGDK